MSKPKKPIKLIDASGEDLSQDTLDAITEALILAGMLERTPEGELIPTGKILENELTALEFVVDDEGDVVSAERLPFEDIPSKLKPQ